MGRYPEGKKTSLNQNFERKIQNILHPKVNPQSLVLKDGKIIQIQKQNVGQDLDLAKLQRTVRGLFEECFTQGINRKLLPEDSKMLNGLKAFLPLLKKILPSQGFFGGHKKIVYTDARAEMIIQASKFHISIADNYDFKNTDKSDQCTMEGKKTIK